MIGGKGSPVVLLHGYAQTSHMWHPVMPLLAKNHTVVVPDLRGAGGSSKPQSGYDKKNMAVDIHELTTSAADPKHSVSEADRKIYARAYAQPGGMRAGFEYFKAFEQDASDFEQLSKTKLSMPMLVLTGEKASGHFLIEQGRLVATNIKGVVIAGSGHWLIDEAPNQVIPQLIAFIDGNDQR